MKFHLFKVPISAGKTLYGAVMAATWEEGLKRLRRDDDIWSLPTVYFIGTSGAPPDSDCAFVTDETTVLVENA